MISALNICVLNTTTTKIVVNTLGIPDTRQPDFIVNLVANMRQAISNHHAGLTTVISRDTDIKIENVYESLFTIFEFVLRLFSSALSNLCGMLYCAMPLSEPITTYSQWAV